MSLCFAVSYMAAVPAGPRFTWEEPPIFDTPLPGAAKGDKGAYSGKRGRGAGADLPTQYPDDYHGYQEPCRQADFTELARHTLNGGSHVYWLQLRSASGEAMDQYIHTNTVIEPWLLHGPLRSIRYMYNVQCKILQVREMICKPHLELARAHSWCTGAPLSLLERCGAQGGLCSVHGSMVGAWVVYSCQKTWDPRLRILTRSRRLVQSCSVMQRNDIHCTK